MGATLKAISVPEWKRLIRPIHDDFYETLVRSAGCGPFDGGCVSVAHAIQLVIGGEIAVLTRSDDRADHAAVLQSGKLWDWDGPLIPKRFIARFNRTELKHAKWICTGYRAIQTGDLKCAFRSSEAESRLASLFEIALAGITLQCAHSGQ